MLIWSEELDYSVVTAAFAAIQGTGEHYDKQASAESNSRVFTPTGRLAVGVLLLHLPPCPLASNFAAGKRQDAAGAGGSLWRAAGRGLHAHTDV